MVSICSEVGRERSKKWYLYFGGLEVLFNEDEGVWRI